MSESNEFKMDFVFHVTVPEIDWQETDRLRKQHQEICKAFDGFDSEGRSE